MFFGKPKLSVKKLPLLQTQELPADTAQKLKSRPQAKSLATAVKRQKTSGVLIRKAPSPPASPKKSEAAPPTPTKPKSDLFFRRL